MIPETNNIHAKSSLVVGCTFEQVICTVLKYFALQLGCCGARNSSDYEFFNGTYEIYWANLANAEVSTNI